ncbi:hypothetical protein I2492_05995 [Budviciaceae bacterium CWB-B4]|uniref:Uncharacterized protein n=1 Tax=Limnobaculum xujianqingii TaxID=2738837 RepID=A0A9D7AH66_9GAMM|nr:hypothetical protein [Limnobaculum xujianqingii]MBK5072560.1 hypothetical protein [Limnobaculum xujianqingii]MBK5175869.1 hypothetical protein [Limnobaculum xujianqingii]
MTNRKKRPVTTSPELALMQEMNARLIRIEANVDEVKAAAMKQGAIAGAISGSVAGGMVAAVILMIKARMGF